MKLMGLYMIMEERHKYTFITCQMTSLTFALQYIFIKFAGSLLND